MNGLINTLFTFFELFNFVCLSIILQLLGWFRAPGEPGQIGRLRKMKKDTGYNYLISFCFCGTPGPIRTGGLRIRREDRRVS